MANDTTLLWLAGNYGDWTVNSLSDKSNASVVASWKPPTSSDIVDAIPLLWKSRKHWSRSSQEIGYREPSRYPFTDSALGIHWNSTETLQHTKHGKRYTGRLS